MDKRDTPAVERVRADLAQLGHDEASAPAVPPAVTDRVVAALRAVSVSESPVRRRAVRLAALVGAVSAVAATALGVANLAGPKVSEPSSHPGTDPTSPTIPLSDAEILALLHAPRDLGVLGDPRRRSSCLSGLGYSGATVVLGGRQLAVGGQPAVLLVLADDSAPAGGTASVVALAVRPNCSTADTGLLAETQIERP
ncbi:MAG: hypothetical protein QOH57_3664 [Mycobacterium sp.]|nr:hypothetical protein [Mycobacterium sp.]